MTTSELVDRRYLAGISLEDATTGAPVSSTLRVSSDGVRFFRNASGLLVVSSAPGLAHHLDEFEAAPATPDVGDVQLTVAVRDDTGFYFPRTFRLDLPRSPDPDAPNSVLQPLRVVLYRSPAAPVSANWSSIDARLVDSATGAPLRNALVRAIQQSDGALLGVGILMAGPRAVDVGAPPARTLGYLSLPLVGIPLVAWSADEDAVSVQQVPVLLEIVAISSALDVFDPDVFIAADGVSVGPIDVAAGKRTNAGTIQVAVPN